MGWYAAHVILYVRFKGHPQDTYPVWENIVLIEANSDEEAHVKAERYGRIQEGDSSGTFRWEGKPATWIYAGVRKVMKCVGFEAQPIDGTELTFSQMVVSSWPDLMELAAGGSVSLLLEE